MRTIRGIAQKKRKPNLIVVAISGGFDPLHMGHILLIQEAKKLGDYLVAIINNDDFLIRKKGYYFMPIEQRALIVNSIKGVDEVYLSKDTDDTVCESLREVNPVIFANGGDRSSANSLEDEVCNQIFCKQVFGIGGYNKLNSSSKIVENFLRRFSGLENG